MDPESIVENSSQMKYYIQYPKGSRLLIELATGQKFEGLVSFCYGSQISLSNVTEYPQSVKVDSELHFKNEEVKSVKELLNLSDPQPGYVFGTPNTAVTEESTIDAASANEEPAEPEPLRSYEMLNKVKELSVNHKYISEINGDYNSAVEHLNKYSEIAVHGLVIEYEDNWKMNLLAMATENNVFIFDIQLIGNAAFDLGLRHLLQSKNVMKIMFQGRYHAECLSQYHNTKLTHVFDIQLIDLILLQSENPSDAEIHRSLIEIIHDYYNLLPHTFEFYKPADFLVKQRPLFEGFIPDFALQVSYIYDLKTILKDRQLGKEMQSLIIKKH